MSTDSLESTKCTCKSEDAEMVDYSEAEKILIDVKRDLQDVQTEIQVDLSKSCPTQRGCKVSSALIKLQNADSKLRKIIDIMQTPLNDDDLSSNFGMSVKLDVAQEKLSDLKKKHDKLCDEWHSQEKHLNKIAEAVAKKEHELNYQSVFCTTQGFVLSKMLWKSSKCDGLLQLMVNEEKLILELIKTLDGCLNAFSRTYQHEMPDPCVDEYQYVVCLCGVLSNIASIPDGRYLLTSQSIGRDVFDQIIKMLPRILVPKAESLKWLMLASIHNLMICKEGREYAKSNRYLLKNVSKCIKPPHSEKIIILSLKIIGNLTNDSSKSYIAHISKKLPIETLSHLKNNTDSVISSQAAEILTNVGNPEKIVHTIQLDQTQSRCSRACTQTPKNRNQDIFAYYVFTDTNKRNNEYPTDASGISSTWDESNDGSDSAHTDFDDSSESKFSERMEPKLPPNQRYAPPQGNVKSISAYNTGYLSPFGSTEEESNSCFGRRNMDKNSLQQPFAGYIGSDRSPTSTPISTYVDSDMLDAVASASNKKITPSSCPSPYKWFADTSSTLTPMSTYVNSKMLNQNVAPPPYSPRMCEQDGATYVQSQMTPPTAASTYVQSRMLAPGASSSYGTPNRPTTEPMAYQPHSCREFRAKNASPISLHSNFPVNLNFSDKSSTLCHPSVWSIPPKPINNFQEHTPSVSHDLLQSQLPQMDLNKLLTISIGDNLENPSAIQRNVGNNTFADGQSSPSILTVFRINSSKECLSPATSCSPFANSISTNTSFPWELTMENLLKMKNTSVEAISKSSRKNVPLYLSESGKVVCGSYESYYERLKKESSLTGKSVNFQIARQRINYDDVNMPSTSTGYYGNEPHNPFAALMDQKGSSSSVLEAKKQNSNSAVEMDQPSCSHVSNSTGAVGKMPEKPKSPTCSPVPSIRKCHVKKAKKKPKKKPYFRTMTYKHRRTF